MLGKVLKVYLVDPRTTWLPVDTPFRLEDLGVHVGFEHGNSVWIKYVTRAPKFTATEWDSSITYNKADLAYSPTTGNCYISKTSNNLGHDPSVPGNSEGLLPPIVAEAPLTPDNPGLPPTPKIVDVMASLPASSRITIPDPPMAGSVSTITVVAADGVTVLGTATHTSSGTESLLAIFTILQGQLSTALTGFTVTLITTPLSIRLQNASEFSVSVSTARMSTGPTFPLAVVQVQAYVPATPYTPGQGQSFTLSITQAQVVSNTLYTTTFTTVDEVQHVAAYTALPTDNAQQILNGLIQNIISMQPTDPFFTGVRSTLDTVSPAATFTLDKSIGMVSLHVLIQPPGGAFWDLVPFPFALVDEVVRGAYANSLKEGGQTDKGGIEEKVVPTELQIAAGKFTAPQYPALTDQSQQRSRYSVK
jgi:hypothetical protein